MGDLWCYQLRESLPQIDCGTCWLRNTKRRSKYIHVRISHVLYCVHFWWMFTTVQQFKSQREWWVKTTTNLNTPTNSIMHNTGKLLYFSRNCNLMAPASLNTKQVLRKTLCKTLFFSFPRKTQKNGNFVDNSKSRLQHGRLYWKPLLFTSKPCGGFNFVAVPFTSGEVQVKRGSGL